MEIPPHRSAPNRRKAARKTTKRSDTKRMVTGTERDEPGHEKKCCVCVARDRPECKCSSKRPNKRSSNGVAISTADGQGLESREAPAVEAASTVVDHVENGRSIKRCQLSPSPATGLIGLQENQFLGDYFGCLGFLAIGSERIVRHALVNVMISAVPGNLRKRQRAHALEAGEAGDSQGQRVGRMLPLFAYTSLLWCGIALGALVQGCPLDRVSTYVRLARASLVVCGHGDTIDTARACLAMAVVHGFLGCKTKELKYLKATRRIMDSLPPADVPMALRDVLGLFLKVWRFNDISPASTEKTTTFPKFISLMDDAHVCSFLLGVQMRFDQAFVEDSSTEGGSAGIDGRWKTGQHQNKERGEGCVGASQTMPEGLRTPPRRWEATLRLKEELLPEMLGISGMVLRSQMRLGVGGIHYYSYLALMQMLDGDTVGFFKSLTLSVAVFLRYPGLCRHESWLHAAHLYLASLAGGNFREVYEQLRAAFNSMRPAGYPQAPAFDESRGISQLCDSVFCRQAQVYEGDGASDATAASI